MKIRGAPIVDENLINELIQDLENALLSGDVNLELVLNVTEIVREKALKDQIPMGVSRRDYTLKVIYDELTRLLGNKYVPLRLNPNEFSVFMFIGIQGSGKTTTIGKLANYLKQDHWNVGLVCTDTWRPGAYEQLKQLGEKIGLETFGDPEEKKAVKLAKNGIKHFTEAKKNVILVDTAGRHKEEKELLKEMEQLDKQIKPHEIILVVDGTLGQSAYSQANAFSQSTQIGSIIVTKLDGTAKGGGAISAAAATQAPIKFIGMGEAITELEKFDPKGFAGRILGLGDLDGILDQVQRAQIAPDEDRAREMMKGHISYSDMLELFESMNKMGGIRKLLDKLPGGLSYNVDDQMLATSKDSMKDFKNIIFSMTPSERDAEVKLGRSRIDRISRGSGVSVEKVRELINQKKVSEKWIKQLGKGKRRGRGTPGFPFNLMG